MVVVFPDHTLLLFNDFCCTDKLMDCNNVLKLKIKHTTKKNNIIHPSVQPGRSSWKAIRPLFSWIHQYWAFIIDFCEYV